MTKSNIIKLRKNDLVETLEQLLMMARRNEIAGCIGAFQMRDGGVSILTYNVDTSQQQALIGHLSVDTVLRIINKTPS